MVDASVERHGNREVAEAFLDFLRSERGPGDPGRLRLPAARPRARAVPDRAPLPPRLFTMTDLGGWSKVNKAVFDPGGVWDSLFTAPSREARGR